MGISIFIFYPSLVYLVAGTHYKFRYHEDLEDFRGMMAFGVPLLVIGVVLLRKGLIKYFSEGK